MPHLPAHHDVRRTAALLILGSAALSAWFWFVLAPLRGSGAAPVESAPTSLAIPGVDVGGSPALLAPAAPVPVGEFLRFAADPLAPETANLSHDYTLRGLRLLAGALAAVDVEDGQPDAVVEQRVAVVLKYADSLQRGRRSSEHTRYARQAFFAAGDALDDLQADSATLSDPAIAATLVMASRVEPERALIEQVDRVQRFFGSAATALASVERATRVAHADREPAGDR